MAEGIGERVREMRDRVNAAAHDLRTVVAEDRKKLVESRSAAEGALNMLRSVHQRARESLAIMASENTHLAAEISEAVVGFNSRIELPSALRMRWKPWRGWRRIWAATRDPLWSPLRRRGGSPCSTMCARLTPWTPSVP